MAQITYKYSCTLRTHSRFIYEIVLQYTRKFAKSWVYRTSWISTKECFTTSTSGKQVFHKIFPTSLNLKQKPTGDDKA